MSKKNIFVTMGIISLILMRTMCFAESAPEQSVKKQSQGAFFINLADYAKGDGSDETEAIQRAIDAIPSYCAKSKSDPKKGGKLYIPRPKKFYGISKTLTFKEKWNITVECESPAVISRDLPTPAYFKWIGKESENQPMFSFNTVMSARIINLSIDGRSAKSVKGLRKAAYGFNSRKMAKKLDPAFGKPYSKGLVGVFVGPSKGDEREVKKLGITHQGLAKMISFDNLSISGCDVGLWVGGYTNQTDAANLSFSNVYINDNDKHGIVVQSTMTVAIFNNLMIHGSGISNMKLYGGAVTLNTYVGTGKCKVADIELQGGGLCIYGAWSEVVSSFIRADYAYHAYPTMPRVIIGVIQGGAGCNTAINYNSPAPLNIIGCAFTGDVLSGSKAGPILAMGVSFVNPEAGFGGEGITKYGRLVRIGAAARISKDPSRAIIWKGILQGRTAPKLAKKGTSPSWLDPYIIDRRNWPGTKPPKDGVWHKGDGIVNTDPNPNVQSKAWRGWICIEAGTPGKWRAYGRLEKK